jgi:peptidoglycan/xylan/chitin deacetylase (PgdA/CDA1 family)
MDWVRVREIADSGMEIGGHTANHVHVEQLNLAGLNDEILTDKHRIESEIGRSITVFAYPFQEKTDAAAAALVRAGYTVVRDDDVFKSAVMTNSFDAFLKAI